MKAFLTLCFYEYPAAMPHINMWENLMEDQKRIICKKEEKNQIEFLIKRDTDIENLVCIPTDSEYDNVLDAFDNVLLLIEKETGNKLDSVKYLKTLIFGKVDSITLCHLNQTIKEFESY